MMTFWVDHVMGVIEARGFLTLTILTCFLLASLSPGIRGGGFDLSVPLSFFPFSSISSAQWDNNINWYTNILCSLF